MPPMTRPRFEDPQEWDYKEINDINPGDVVYGPTGGLEYINKRIGFIYSASATKDGTGDRIHKQIVLGKIGGGRLETVLVTSLGGTRKDETVWDRWHKNTFTRKKWGEGLRYLVPLYPGKVDPGDHEEFKQPNVVIKYAPRSGQLSLGNLALWASVATQFTLKPFPNGPQAGKYPVAIGVKISDESVVQLKNIVDKTQRDLYGAELGPTRESSAGTAAAEQKPAQHAPRGGEGKASIVTSDLSGETQSSSEVQGGLSFAAVAARQPKAPQPKAPQPGAPQLGAQEEKKTTTSDKGSKQSYAKVAAKGPKAPQPGAQEEEKTTTSGNQSYARVAAKGPEAPQPNAPQPNAPQPGAREEKKSTSSKQSYAEVTAKGPEAPQPEAPQPNTPQPNAPQPRTQEEDKRTTSSRRSYAKVAAAPPSTSSRSGRLSKQPPEGSKHTSGKQSPAGASKK